MVDKIIRLITSALCFVIIFGLIGSVLVRLGTSPDMMLELGETLALLGVLAWLVSVYRYLSEQARLRRTRAAQQRREEEIVRRKEYLAQAEAERLAREARDRERQEADRLIREAHARRRQEQEEARAKWLASEEGQREQAEIRRQIEQLSQSRETDSDNGPRDRTPDPNAGVMGELEGPPADPGYWRWNT